MRALISTDARLASYRFTAAARSPDRSELFFGSDGAGVVRVDPATGEWNRVVFGLIATRAGAVAAAPGGVWVASAGRVGERRGVTWGHVGPWADGKAQGPGEAGGP